jgi:hypothetical protein
MSADLCGRHCQAGEGGGGCAAGQRRRQTRGRGLEGEMEGEVEGEVEGEEGEEDCWAVLVIVISIILSNNTYFTSIPLLE